MADWKRLHETIFDFAAELGVAPAVREAGQMGGKTRYYEFSDIEGNRYKFTLAMPYEYGSGLLLETKGDFKPVSVSYRRNWFGQWRLKMSMDDKRLHGEFRNLSEKLSSFKWESDETGLKFRTTALEIGLETLLLIRQVHSDIIQLNCNF